MLFPCHLHIWTGSVTPGNKLLSAISGTVPLLKYNKKITPLKYIRPVMCTTEQQPDKTNVVGKGGK